MSGTFSSLSSALSALRYNRVAMDVASGNVANAGTTGYARRSVIGQATGAPATPALWSRWEGAGDGVDASSVNRMVDPLLDARSRAEHSTSAQLDARSTSLVRFETTLAEPGAGGVAAALDAFQQGWHDVANNPGDSASGVQLLARAESLRGAIATQGTAVDKEWTDQRTRLTALGDDLNATAAQLADLNKGLRAAYVSGTDAGNLLDQRDQLTLKLATLAGTDVTVNADSTVDVRLGGQPLVTGNTAGTVTVAGSATLAGVGASPVTLQLGGAPVAVTGGTAGGTLQVLNGDLPGYVAKLDSFVSTMVTAVNSQHALGVDRDGAAGGAVFSGTTAATLQVAITDPRKLASASAAAAAAAPGGKSLDNTNATALANLDIGAGAYRGLITGFGVTVSATRQASDNQAVLTSQVDAARESVSGISIDEEMVNLLAAQRGYEGASRVLTTMDSVLDTLINRTGLTH